MLLQQNTIKAQKQDIRIDGKSTRTKKYISMQVWKDHFPVVANIYLQKKGVLLNCLQIEAER